MKVRVFVLLSFWVLIIFSTLAQPLRAHAEDWLDIDPADLAMKDNPKHAGDHAMILWREVTSDDVAGRENHYIRIKIFDDAGKSYADVEIKPYHIEGFQVNKVEGRTIHPDGSIVSFEGTLLDKKAKYRFTTETVKTFTLPDVTPGSIIEYRYSVSWSNDWVPNTHWWVQGELYQRKAHFSLRCYDYYPLYWSPRGLTASQLPVLKKNKVTLDVEDMAGYEKETDMPPLAEVRARVFFFYLDREAPKTPDAIWKEEGKSWGRRVDSFLSKGGAMKAEVASLVSPADTDTVKLQKIYDRVQSLRNLSLEPEKTGKEIQREKRREANNAEDVLRNGYGWHYELNRLFVALARAAGLDATLVDVSDREDAFFDKNYITMRQFDGEIVRVQSSGQTLFLDPGTAFCPYGRLPWQYTASMGMMLDKDPQLVPTPGPTADMSGIVRRADLTMQTDGSVQGTIELAFSGIQAMTLRQEENNHDNTAHKKNMEELLRKWIPASATVDLQRVNDWKSSKLPLVVTYQVSIPGYASPAGSKVILPMAIFAGAYGNPFVSKSRSNKILFPYAYTEEDDVIVHLAPGIQVDTLPKEKSLKRRVGEFSADCKSEGPSVLHATRRFRLDQIFLEKEYYPAARAFFAQLEATDDEQAMLKITN